MSPPAKTDTFLLHWNARGPDHAEVKRFPDRATAERFARGLPGDQTAHVVATVDDLAEWKGGTLVAVFNAVTLNDPGVKRFADLDRGRRRLIDALWSAYGQKPIAAPSPIAAPVSKPTAVSKPSSKPRVARQATAPASTRERFPDDAVVEVLVENPHRPGGINHDRFNRLLSVTRDGRTTVGQAVAVGVPRSEFTFYVKKGYVRIA